MLNQKGDILLYIIFTIILIIIGAIIYYVYLNYDFNSNKDENTSVLNNLKSKLPSKNVSNVSYSNNYKFNAKINYFEYIKINNSNLFINGKPNISFNNSLFMLSEPTIYNFEGNLSSENIVGFANYINGKDYNLNINSDITVDYSDVENIIINDFYYDLERSNINGTIKIDTSGDINLNKAYLKIKGFKGKVIYDPEENILEFDGNIGYIKVKNDGLVIEHE